MSSFIINLKEKGRGFSRALPPRGTSSASLLMRPAPHALSHQPLPGSFLNRKEVYSCEDNNNP